MSTAKAITKKLAAKGIERKAPGAIYCVLMDGPRSVCFTESMLDTWFINLTPEQKAEICETWHDGPTEVDAVEFSLGEAQLRSGLGPIVDEINRRAKELESLAVTNPRDFVPPFGKNAFQINGRDVTISGLNITAILDELAGVNLA